ncbi:CGH_3_HP_G0034770.mRNA.1.CDS.1 [Saccharomyces cerevisiae]|nr:CGH_3_HP_G0034770.mRNA.1.CDS.1 [Saccharomyces cerevisiae]CAI4971545.1 CGH_1_HP_G0052320.mRNA.1.CDS.1 [Saccharomyces cerevisiae]CAI6501278.1 CGH_3_HP_G0034770.mRNA.1.CDS.1 [Saccharomyces cerevisiae]CAI6758487.1 CGH_1_HP_G0052320.mRNA.1.CDS.1 [Saccharomyces cerevisiae]CAI7391967.1 CGH_3_collapsed_G0033890.mRNA.1.CDS.1 [Saccharomyces cerevisiae]
MSEKKVHLRLRKELSVPIAVVENESLAQLSYEEESQASLMDISMEQQQLRLHSHFDNSKVFTENNRYIVKTLQTDYSSGFSNDDELNGYIDMQIGYGLVNDHKKVYIWNIHSTQKDTPYITVPFRSDDNDEIAVAPRCILTFPATMDESPLALNPNDQDETGGLIIIKGSKAIYYEDINSINNLNFKLSEKFSHELELPINSSGGEKCDLMLNCEPAGIVLSTNMGRIFFITIRNSMGKPQLKLGKLLNKPFKLGIWSKIFNTNSSVVSLRNGPILGKGTRLVYITTNKGIFQTWQLSATNSHPTKLIDVNIYEAILESLQDLYPFAHGTLKIWDSHPLQDESSQLFLSSIYDSSCNETYYILSTIIFDSSSNSFTIFSTYRLNTFMESITDTKFKPKIFIPQMENANDTNEVTSILVMFPNAVVITQVNSKLDSSYSMRRKWEDIVSLRNDIDIIGSGYDSKSLYVLTKQMGVLQFFVKENEETNSKPEVGFVKSHVDQAVYFSKINANPIDFNLPPEISLDQESIEHDLKLTSEEIFHSNGKYIPPMLNTLGQHLSVRKEFFQNFLTFVAKNFNYKISPELKLDLIEKFEILNCCIKFNSIIRQSDVLNDIWEKTLSNYNLTQNEHLTTKTVVINSPDVFPVIFKQFLNHVVFVLFPSQNQNFKLNVINLINLCFYDGILEEGEKTIRYELLELDPMEVDTSKLPWFINFDYLNCINQCFFDFTFACEEEGSLDSYKEGLLKIVKILYYQFNQFKIWINTQPVKSVNANDNFININNLYDDNHLDWNHVLCKVNLKEQCIQIAEFYKDLSGLVQTLQTLDQNDSTTVSLYETFFNEFPKEFSFTLFEYLIKHKKLNDLIFRFPQQHDVLIQFFQESAPKYGHVAWIQQILDGSYADAMNTLKNITVDDSKKGESFSECELHLNVAKLSSLLVEKDNLDINTLRKIQYNLDTIDAEKNISNKLKKGEVQICKRFKNGSIREVFNILVEELKSTTVVNLSDLVELYSMLDDEESLFIPLRLLSVDGNLLNFEVKKFLNALVWRRIVLLNDSNEGDKLLQHIVKRVFDEELPKNNDFPLPSVDLLCDKSLLTPEYISETYGRFPIDQNAIREEIYEEISQVETLNSDNSLEIKLHSTIGSVAKEKNYTINYETNTVEY